MVRLCAWLLGAIFAAGCAPPAKIKLVMHMRADQQDVYRNRILKPFEKKNKCIVELQTYEDASTLPHLLTSGDTVDLVSPPLSMTRSLVARNLIAPLDEMVTPKQLEELRKEFYLMDLGSMQGQTFFMPRYLETPVLIYLKSQVAEAVQYWEIRKDDINALLTKHNGKGLPRAYVLERDPSQWDYFDLFVVGYFWSTKEVQGQKRGRMALGPIGSPSMAQSLMDKCFQTGAAPESLLRMTDDAIVDMFHWQSVMVREGILNPNLVKGRWSDDKIREGFMTGELFLTEATQMEAFLIRGTGTPEMPGYLINPEDMGVALMPKGNSFELDPLKGTALRDGRHSVGTRGYWWGVTRQARNPKLVYELARYLSNTQNQILESSSFGSIPVRQDLLPELGLMFGGGWMSEVFQTASRQLVENRYSIAPLVEEITDMGKNYLNAYQDLCLPGAGQKTTFEAIKKALEEQYIPRQRQILGAKYPARVLSSR